jgi:hypothetical protein
VAEEKEETRGVEKPPLDPSKLLTQIEALLRKNSKSTDPHHGGTSRISKSWIWAIILPLIALAGIAAFSWFVFRRNRELAKLRHEKFKRETLAKKAEVDSYVAKGNEEVAKAQAKIDLAEKQLKLIEADVRAEEKRYEADLAAIDRIRGWDGSYVRHGG